jgi:hypothetical protein
MISVFNYASAYNNVAFEGLRRGRTVEYISKEMYHNADRIDISHEWDKLIDGGELKEHIDRDGKALFDLLRFTGEQLNSLAVQFDYPIVLDSRDHFIDGDSTCYVTDLMERDMKQISELNVHINTVI